MIDFGYSLGQTENTSLINQQILLYFSWWIQEERKNTLNMIIISCVGGNKLQRKSFKLCFSFHRTDVHCESLINLNNFSQSTCRPEYRVPEYPERRTRTKTQEPPMPSLWTWSARFTLWQIRHEEKTLWKYFKVLGNVCQTDLEYIMWTTVIKKVRIWKTYW